MPKLRNLSGQLFNRLTALAIVGRDNNHKVLWRCACTCGNNVVVPSGNLVTGNSESCGCLQRELATLKARESNTIHGHRSRGSRSPEHYSWAAMRSRCNNPKHTAYKNYGGRGITVCAEWDSFEQFLKDLGPRPPGKTLDRMNVDGNYTPANVRWATSSEQNRNKRCLRRTC